MCYAMIIGSLSGVSPQPRTREDLITWLFFTIFLPIAPLLLSYTTLIIFVKRNTQWKEFVDLIKDGELFFFTTILAATSLNKLQALSQVASSTSFVQIPLWAILVVSLFCFALTVYNKLDQAAFNLRVSLLSIQYRLNRHISSQSGKKSNIINMETELAEVIDQLAELQTIATKTGTLLKHAKNPLQNPSRPNLKGMRERVWGITLIAIFVTIVVCLLSYEVYLYGGS